MLQICNQEQVAVEDHQGQGRLPRRPLCWPLCSSAEDTTASEILGQPKVSNRDWDTNGAEPAKEESPDEPKKREIASSLLHAVHCCAHIELLVCLYKFIKYIFIFLPRTRWFRYFVEQEREHSSCLYTSGSSRIASQEENTGECS